MNNSQPNNSFNVIRLFRRLFLSAFVVFSFIAYAIQKPGTSSNTASQGNATQTPAVPAVQQDPLPTATPQAATSNQSQPNPAPTDTTQANPTGVPPTDTPLPVAPVASGYKDGTYTGPEVDAYFGLVQAQAVVQNGKIINVQIIKYPTDRRTSQRINAFAVPYLQQEAIQAQSENVDIITGATLTSQAFMQSLQYALNKAKGGA